MMGPYFYLASIILMIRAGFPPTTAFSGTSFVTTAPAAITALFPIVTLESLSHEPQSKHFHQSQ